MWSYGCTMICLILTSCFHWFSLETTFWCAPQCIYLVIFCEEIRVECIPGGAAQPKFWAFYVSVDTAGAPFLTVVATHTVIHFNASAWCLTQDNPKNMQTLTTGSGVSLFFFFTFTLVHITSVVALFMMSRFFFSTQCLAPQLNGCHWRQDRGLKFSILTQPSSYLTADVHTCRLEYLTCSVSWQLPWKHILSSHGYDYHPAVCLSSRSWPFAGSWNGKILCTSLRLKCLHQPLHYFAQAAVAN